VNSRGMGFGKEGPGACGENRAEPGHAGSIPGG
jgi:hypothetical protein